jgi:hypothetical protein
MAAFQWGMISVIDVRVRLDVVVTVVALLAATWVLKSAIAVWKNRTLEHAHIEQNIGESNFASRRSTTTSTTTAQPSDVSGQDQTATPERGGDPSPPGSTTGETERELLGSTVLQRGKHHNKTCAHIVRADSSYAKWVWQRRSSLGTDFQPLVRYLESFTDAERMDIFLDRPATSSDERS